MARSDWRTVDPSHVKRLRYLTGMTERGAIAALNRSMDDQYTDDELSALANGHDPEPPPSWEP